MTSKPARDAAIIDVTRRVLVAARTTAEADYGLAIMPALDSVWPFLRTASVSTGQNVTLYEGPTLVAAGAEVSGPWPELPDGLVIVETPAGRAATAVHIGRYEGLPTVHRQLRRWCETAGVELTGVSWEVYGDWDEDPTKLRTDVFYELRG